MRCGRCGAELEDTAVFCDKCGEFVMRPAERGDGLDAVQGNGKRIRSRSDFWLFFRISARIIIVLAGIAAVIVGYRFASRTEGTADKYSPNAEAWDIMQLRKKMLPLPSYDKNTEHNTDNGES